MSATALALILVAAVAHATWNLFSKQASAAGASSFVWLMSLAATGLYAPVVAVSVLLSPPRLTLLDWVFMVGTGLLQVGYFLFLQAGYRLGDLSLVYPLGRGSGALLAALAGITLLGERPGPAGITGIVLVVLGVLVLGAPGRGGDSPAPPRPGTPAQPAALPGDRLRAGDRHVHRVLHALGQVRGEHAPGAAAHPGLRLAPGDGPGPGPLRAAPAKPDHAGLARATAAR